MRTDLRPFSTRGLRAGSSLFTPYLQPTDGVCFEQIATTVSAKLFIHQFTSFVQVGSLYLPLLQGRPCSQLPQLAIIANSLRCIRATYVTKMG